MCCIAWGTMYTATETRQDDYAAFPVKLYPGAGMSRSVAAGLCSVASGVYGRSRMRGCYLFGKSNIVLWQLSLI